MLALSFVIVSAAVAAALYRFGDRDKRLRGGLAVAVLTMGVAAWATIDRVSERANNAHAAREHHCTWAGYYLEDVAGDVTSALPDALENAKAKFYPAMWSRFSSEIVLCVETNPTSCSDLLLSAAGATSSEAFAGIFRRVATAVRTGTSCTE